MSSVCPGGGQTALLCRPAQATGQLKVQVPSPGITPGITCHARGPCPMEEGHVSRKEDHNPVTKEMVILCLIWWSIAPFLDFPKLQSRHLDFQCELDHTGGINVRMSWKIGNVSDNEKEA